MGQYQVKSLTGQHKEALRLAAVGFRAGKIAEWTGLSVWQISRIKNSEQGRMYLEALHRRMDIAAAQTMAASTLMMPPDRLHLGRQKRAKA